MTSPIPAEALAHHIAILAKTGAGKSNAAKTLVEDALDRGERVCVLDPTGTWYGLRLKPNGKPSPYPIVIFGGNHADLPIGGGHGSAIAEMVGTSATPAIIDTRLLSVGDRTRFATDFAEALLRRNVGELTLVIDEAHLFAPKGKVNDPKSGMMLGAFNNLVSLGRGIGLRIILISQRPAKLHNDCLSCAETLVAMRMILPADREAVMSWIREQADAAQGREIVGSLPSLPTGDAWIWSPQLDLLERRRFRLAQTFDSGKAPTAGQAGPALAPLNLAEVTARLEKVAADVVANDPKALKAEVARLTGEIAQVRKLGAAADPKAVQSAEQRGYERGHDDGSAQVLKALGGIATDLAASVGAANEACERSERLLASFGSFVETQAAAPRARTPMPHSPPSIEAAKINTPPSRSAAVGAVRQPSSELGAKAKVLQSLAWWKAAGFPAIDRRRACIMAGYSPKASTFGVYIGQLAAAGLIEIPEPGKIGLTAAGEVEAPAPTSGGNLVDAVRALLSPAEVKVFDVVVAAHPAAITRGDLADAVGLSRTASTLGVYVGKVASFGFVESTRGQVRAADWLFPGAAS